jgi:hypothetical protein
MSLESIRAEIEYMRLPVKPVWYDHNADNPPWIKALFHVQAITLAIEGKHDV